MSADTVHALVNRTKIAVITEFRQVITIAKKTIIIGAGIAIVTGGREGADAVHTSIVGARAEIITNDGDVFAHTEHAVVNGTGIAIVTVAGTSIQVNTFPKSGKSMVQLLPSSQPPTETPPEMPVKGKAINAAISRVIKVIFFLFMAPDF